MADEYPWVRRENERGPAYAAFREYLKLDPKQRTIKDAAEAVGITFNSAKELYARHDWKERAVAYDQHLATAATDGLASQMASARDDNLTLADKLRGHLSTQLDDCIHNHEDPSVRWSQALSAMVRLEEHAFRLKDDPKTSAARTKVNEFLRRIEEASSQ